MYLNISVSPSFADGPNDLYIGLCFSLCHLSSLKKIIFHLNFLNSFACFLLHSLCLSPLFPLWHPFKLSLFPPSLGVNDLSHSTPFKSNVLLLSTSLQTRSVGMAVSEGRASRGWAQALGGFCGISGKITELTPPSQRYIPLLNSCLWLGSMFQKDDKLQQPFLSLQILTLTFPRAAYSSLT